MEKTIKTNALRILDKQKIPYKIYTYEWSEDKTGGNNVTEKLKEVSDRIFKTIVLTGKSKKIYVCVIQVNTHIDLKKAAKACKEKSMELLPLSELEKNTGYIRGGCSPVGMKKKFPTYFDIKIDEFDKIVVSAGRRGIQMEILVKDLLKITDGEKIKLITD